LSPSSFGLQPWKFIIVRDPALRKQLKAHAWDQPQITDADALIVFCALKTMDEGVCKELCGPYCPSPWGNERIVINYEQMMLASLKGKSPEALSQWMKRQVYIALGVLL
jgi:nitroreductase